MKLFRIFTSTAIISIISISTVLGANEGVTNADKVNGRSGPSISSTAVTDFSNGYNLKLESVNGDFFKVGDVFVSNQYVKVIVADGIVNSDSVNIRSAASTDGNVLGTVNKGNTITTSLKVGQWYKVSFNGKTGYINSQFVDGEFLKFLQVSSDEELAKAQVVPKAATSTYAVANASGGLNMRESYDIDSKVVTVIPNGEIITVVESGSEWTKVSYNGNTGYVKNAYVNIRNGQPPSRGAGSSNGDKVTAYAQQFIGTPYVWAGNSLTRGVDCSGFTSQVYKNFGVTLHRIAKDQYNDGVKVSKANLQKGDLVFFNTSGSNKSYINHVGIYIGNGNFTHASSGRSRGVTVSDITKGFYANAYVGACRVLK